MSMETNHKIFCLIGKSASGKDTIFKELLKDGTLGLRTIVTHTTRPIRSGEQDGREYFFSTAEDFQDALAGGRVIEYRAYDTVYGIWYYYTEDDGQIDLSRHSYILIGTLESFTALREYYGKDFVVPVLLQVDDGERLQRALNREREQKQPKYAEMCRRFLADESDFSPDNIQKAGIARAFVNDDPDRCLHEICGYIREQS